MINAERARKIANEAISEKSQTQMAEIEELILDAAKNGQLSCHIEEHVMPMVAICLKEMGYSVKNNPPARDGCWTIISWSEA